MKLCVNLLLLFCIKSFIVLINGQVQTTKSELMCREYGKYASWESCNMKATDSIFSVTKANSSEFPHMALIGYENDEDSMVWICIGGLISEKFILLPASCAQYIMKRNETAYVRLGESDLASAYDDALPVDALIATYIIHPNYRKGNFSNNIALIELRASVISLFNRYIRPICLNRKSVINETNVIASGWDLTSGYNHMNKMSLQLFNNTECNEIYDTSTISHRRIDVDSEICAGLRNATAESPTILGILQANNTNIYCKYDLIGISSFGPSGKTVDVPDVFTRVAHYIDWIEGIVWP